MSQFSLSGSPNQLLAPPLATSSPVTPDTSLAGPRCCGDSGRLIFSDPGSPAHQSEPAVAPAQLLAYQKLAAAGLPMMYGYDAAYLQALQSRAAAAAAAVPHMKEGGLPLGGPMGSPSWPYGLYYPYGESAISPYGLAPGYGYALDGARRKNATRETTSTLKAWLNEHKKNPYPTKGEKIMLAIITKMTLTQVSTWFANARRRLKKENKMTWEPRNRTDDDEGDSDVEATKSDDEHHTERRDSADEAISADRDVDNRSSSPAMAADEEAEGPSPTSSPVKPRIWSLADLAVSSSSQRPPLPHGIASMLPSSVAAVAAAGKMMMSFSRPHHHALPYARPQLADPHSMSRLLMRTAAAAPFSSAALHQDSVRLGLDLASSRSSPDRSTASPRDEA